MGGDIPVMVKLSLVQFALDPVEVALRPGEGNRDQAPRSIFSLRGETMWMEWKVSWSLVSRPGEHGS